MTTGTSETDAHYTGLIKGGYWASVLGSLGLLAIIVTNLVSEYTLDVSLMILAGVSCAVGAFLILATLILRELVDHKADHQRGAIDLNDIVTMRRQIADVLAFIARWDVERAEERKMVAQIEAFLGWLERAKQRASDEAANRATMSPAQRDAAWMSDMAEAMEIGREIERRRPPEEH